MDPDATWVILNDEAADADDRNEAALNLLVWLAGGGHPPKAAPGLRPRAETIAKCERRLWDVLDAAQHWAYMTDEA